LQNLYWKEVSYNKYGQTIHVQIQPGTSFDIIVMNALIGKIFKIKHFWDIKFIWNFKFQFLLISNIATLTGLHIACDCFHATMAECKSGNWIPLTTNLKCLYLANYRKSLQATILNHYLHPNQWLQSVRDEISYKICNSIESVTVLFIPKPKSSMQKGTKIMILVL
jgi:hypothetical protein